VCLGNSTGKLFWVLGLEEDVDTGYLEIFRLVLFILPISNKQLILGLIPLDIQIPPPKPFLIDIFIETLPCYHSK